jgi:acyl-CoA reductase-like NAD-dependent aldehyde dehydrogenase|eukprot:SAG25_NODE_99_length_15727_cov_45.389685_1_plen_108_part_00
MHRYEGFPKESKEAWKNLQSHWDEVLEKTKTELRDMIGATDPKVITEGLAKFDEAYGANIAEERATLLQRFANLMSEANEEMTKMANEAGTKDVVQRALAVAAARVF